MNSKSNKLYVRQLAALMLLFMLPVMLPGQVPADRSDLNVRQADTDRIADYKNDPEFLYDESQPEISLIGMLIREVIQFFDQALGEGTGNTILRVVFTLTMAGVVYLLINQFMKGNLSSALTGRSASEDIRFRQNHAASKEADLSSMIESAAHNGNYREAVRLLYQQALKELSRAGVIRWAANKTNLDYIYEMDAHPSSASFRRLTRIYEYTEYGDFVIGRDGFLHMRELYRNMSEHLSGERDA